jgi:spore coat protein A, manganese oxidase
MNSDRVTSTFLGIGWLAVMSACSSEPGLGQGQPGRAVAALSDLINAASLAGEPPLPIPPVLAPTSGDAGSDFYSITIRPGLAQMRAGDPTPIVGFDGVVPGPTIVATRGRSVQIQQSNDWTENLSIHNHGHKVAASSDGHPTDYVAPGGSKLYTYPNDQNAGTYWYHDHAMDRTGPHVYQGLAGFYIIRDPAQDALGLPSGAYDIPLLIQDKNFNSDNSLSYEPDVFLGLLGDTAVVNGVATPYLDVGTRKYRFRLLNGSNARPLAVQLRVNGDSTAQPFQVIASDGGLLQAPVELTTLPIAPAERYDVVVDFGQYPVGTKLDFINGENAEAPALTELLQFVVARSEPDSSVVPTSLADVQRHEPGEAVGTQQIVFAFDGEDWTLNGLTYDPARSDVTSKLDQVYIWSLVNESSLPHPFHKHLSLFNILDIDGQPPPSFLNGWKDTVMVPPGSTVRIAFKDETFSGTYVFHCHILEHEDHGMMLQEQVGG